MPSPMASSPRVLHYVDAIREAAGGVVRSVIDLCNVLALEGCDVTLATYDCHDIPPEWATSDCGPKVVDLSQGESFTSALRNADVLHLHTPWDRRNVTFAKEAKAAGKPYVLSVHGMLDDWSMDQKGFKKRLYLWLTGRRMLEGAFRVHCTAEGEQRQASKWYPRGESAVLPLVVDLPNRASLPGPQIAIDMFDTVDWSLPTVLFLSRLHPKKGVDILLRAAELSMRGCPPFELVIAGPGEEAYVAELQRLAEELGLADRAHFVGLVQGDVKLSLYEACDLFVLPTHQENFGLVLPESLACGTPVATTKGVDIWPEIEAAGGVIFDNRPEPLAAQLTTLLANREELAELGSRGRDYVYKWLDPQRVVRGFVQLYGEAAGG